MADDLEVEHTYAPPTDAPRPDLTGLPGVARAADARAHVLEAVYYDTPDAALLRAGVNARSHPGADGTGSGVDRRSPNVRLAGVAGAAMHP